MARENFLGIQNRRKPMRATWKTSIAAGVAMGLAATLSEDRHVTWAMGAFFFISVFVGVVGISQLREMAAKRRQRKSWMDHQLEDGPAFLVPAWGRMAVWFVSAGATMLLANAVH